MNLVEISERTGSVLQEVAIEVAPAVQLELGDYDRILDFEIKVGSFGNYDFEGETKPMREWRWRAQIERSVPEDEEPPASSWQDPEPTERPKINSWGDE